MQPRFISITFARQFGSGGSELAQRVAGELGWPYLDRELLRQAAEEMGVDEAELIEQDEHVTGFWQRLLETFILSSPEEVYMPPPLRTARDEQLMEVMQRIMCRLARENHCVVVGRGSFHCLQGHARLLNIFVHAPRNARCQRVATIYGLRDPEAAVDLADRDREHYIHWATGRQWLDPCNYHLSIDTACIGLEHAQRWIVEQARRMAALAPERAG